MPRRPKPHWSRLVLGPAGFIGASESTARSNPHDPKAHSSPECRGFADPPNRRCVERLRSVACRGKRARAGREKATVATPLDWKELNARLDPKKFDIKTALKRFAKARKDPLLALTGWQTKHEIRR